MTDNEITITAILIIPIAILVRVWLIQRADRSGNAKMLDVAKMQNLKPGTRSNARRSNDNGRSSHV